MVVMRVFKCKARSFQRSSGGGGGGGGDGGGHWEARGGAQGQGHVTVSAAATIPFHGRLGIGE